MTELTQLYKDLIKIQVQDEIKREMGRKEFWLGFGFIVTGLMVIISFILV